MICGNFEHNGIKKKCEFVKVLSAELFREAASFFLDDVYTRISDLKSNAQMFGADLVYHHTCLSAYIQKYKRAISVKERGPIRVTKKIFERYINFIRDFIESGS